MGDPMRPLRWVSKSHAKLAAALCEMGHQIANVGGYKNAGSDYRPEGCPDKVKVHDFGDTDRGKSSLMGSTISPPTPAASVSALTTIRHSSRSTRSDAGWMSWVESGIRQRTP